MFNLSHFIPTEYPALGMESMQIGDNQLKVSTYLASSTHHCTPRGARAKRPREVNLCVVWVPKPETASNQWFQVSFHVGYAFILSFLSVYKCVCLD